MTASHSTSLLPRAERAGTRIAILGTGGIARGTAALLAAAGHEVVLWSPTGRDDGLAGGELTATGILPGTFEVALADGCGAAVAGAGCIVVAAVGNGHRAIFEALAPHVRAGQLVLVSAHLSFGALYLSQLLAERGIETPVAALATTLLTARRTGPAAVHISGLRQRLDLASVPTAQAGDALRRCEALFGPRLDARDDLLAIMLSNLNPPAHMANLLLNLTRAERGEDWPNYGSMTPAVARLIEALDRERLALAAAFGLEVRTIEDHFVLSHGIARASLAEMAATVHARRPELMGPKSLDTRFVTEDVPFGLVPLEWLGALAGVAMPLHTAGIELFGAVYGRDFRAENDLLPVLELGGADAAQVHRATREGSPRRR